MRITSLVRAWLAITVALVGASTVHAQTTTTETLTFDNNQMPSGWSYTLLPGSQGNNLQIQNQRLEIGQVDTYGGISKAIDTSGATQVKIEYDANIANVYWGQGTAAVLVNDPTNWSTNFASVNMNKNGFGQDAMNFGSHYALAGNSPTGVYNNVVSPPVFGNYHMSAIFENGQISQTATNLDTGATFSSGVTAAPGFLLSDMHNVVLWGVTTTGTSAWIDNATISVTAVPEPETYTMLLAGLSLIGVMGRRRITKGSSKLNFQ